MSFRAKRPSRPKRREEKRSAWESSVRAEAAKRAPIVKYAPARPPISPVISRVDDQLGYVDVVELNKRPENRVIEVPIRPLVYARMLEAGGSPLDMYIHTERFQAVPYHLRVDATEFVWWSWMPVREALKPGVAYGMRRAMAYAERIRGHMMYIEPMLPAWIAKDFTEWVNVVIEDCEQNLGMP